MHAMLCDEEPFANWYFEVSFMFKELIPTIAAICAQHYLHFRSNAYKCLNVIFFVRKFANEAHALSKAAYH